MTTRSMESVDPCARRRRSMAIAAALLICAATVSVGAALEPTPAPKSIAEWLFQPGEARASVREGLLLGRGYERIEHTPSGGLRVLRTKTYQRIRDPESRRVVELPEAWHVRSLLELSPDLRLRSAETVLSFHRSVDRALGRNASDDELAPLFEWNRILVAANAAGDELHASTKLGKRVIAGEHYDYPRDGVPLEIVDLVMSLAVSRHRDNFEFEFLLPDASAHGVTARVHRVTDPSPFADGYDVPSDRFRDTGREMAVVDMWLSSPIKYLFFPHHFYFMYESARPSELLAVWGGDPDEHLQAFRDP